MTQRGRMRVMHLADALEGGGAEGMFRTTIEISRLFATDVRVMVAEGKSTPLGYLFSLRQRARVLAAMREFRPDVIHVQNYYHSLSPSVLSAIRVFKKDAPGLRVVFTAHDYHLVCPNSGMQWFPRGQRTNVPIEERPIRLLRRYDHRTWGHAVLKIAQHFLAYRVLRLQDVFDDVISPSEFLACALGGRGLAASLHVLRNPLRLDKKPRAQSNASRARVARAMKLAFVARLVPEKGLRELLMALAEIQESMPTELHVFGDGPQKEEMVSLAASLGLGERAIFHGQRPHEQLWRTVRDLDALVIPSIWYENAPQVVLEAAAVGVPVIGNHLGGIVEMCRQTTVAQTCDTASGRELEQALVATRAGHARNEIRQPGSFSPERYQLDLERVYRGDSITAYE